MKYVSFSLWGDKPIYNVGAIRNAELMSSIYPDWKMVVYFDETVPVETLDALVKLNVDIIDVSGLGLYGMFWRFLSVGIEDAEYSIFRDCDSRISLREKVAVDEWISSGKTLHVMRDHPAHGIPFGSDQLGILGGMWGIKCGVIPLKGMIMTYPKAYEFKYGNDQTFLKYIYNTLINDRCTHDDFFEHKPFTVKRENGRFIGERIDINDMPLTNDHKVFI